MQVKYKLTVFLCCLFTAFGIGFFGQTDRGGLDQFGFRRIHVVKADLSVFVNIGVHNRISFICSRRRSRTASRGHPVGKT